MTLEERRAILRRTGFAKNNPVQGGRKPRSPLAGRSAAAHREQPIDVYASMRYIA